jgi:hypothetical protein
MRKQKQPELRVLVSGPDEAAAIARVMADVRLRSVVVALGAAWDLVDETDRAVIFHEALRHFFVTFDAQGPVM